MMILLLLVSPVVEIKPQTTAGGLGVAIHNTGPLHGVRLLKRERIATMVFLI
jgi:hypothetical protein